MKDIAKEITQENKEQSERNARYNDTYGDYNMDTLQLATDDELYNAFDEYLDSEEDITICGMKYQVSRVLESVDPIAYGCLFDEFVDSLLVNGTLTASSLNEQVYWS